MSKETEIKNIPNDPFSVADAKKVGISTRMLHYLARKGVIHRVSRGFYTKKALEALDHNSLIKEAILQIKGPCVVCLATALQLHDLTEDIPHYFELFVPRENVPKKKLQDVRFHSLRQSIDSLDTIEINGILVTSIEQTIVDLLRFNFPFSKILEIYHEAIAKGKSIQLDLLKKIAKKHRAITKVNNLIEAVL